jgi:hypothetical protein
MAETPPRRFNLGDALILIAAVAAGLAGARFQAEWFEWTPDDLWPKLPLSPWRRLRIAAPMVAQLATPALLSGSAAVVLCRLRAPRPRRVRLWRQPGFLACLAACSPFAWKFAPTFAVILRVTASARRPVPPGGLDWGGPSVDWSDLLPNVLPAQVYAAPAVLLAWLVTWAAGRCRLEPSWIDRTGRAIGVLWLLVSALIALDRAETMGMDMSAMGL